MNCIKRNAMPIILGIMLQEVGGISVFTWEFWAIGIPTLVGFKISIEQLKKDFICQSGKSGGLS